MPLNRISIIAFLLFSVLFNSKIGFAEGHNKIGLGIVLESFSYKEDFPPPGKSEESAFLPLIRLDYQRHFEGSLWSIGSFIEATSKQSTYNGSNASGTVPITGDHDNDFVSLEVNTSRSFQNKKGAPLFQAYGGFGMHYWFRNLQQVGTTGYRERYLWFYLPLGGRVSFSPAANWYFAGDLSIRFNLGGTIKAYLSDVQGRRYTDGSGSLGFAVGTRVELRATYLLNPAWSVTLRPFFEYRPIGEGAEFDITDQSNGTVEKVHEPASTTLLFGAILGPTFQF